VGACIGTEREIHPGKVDRVAIHHERFVGGQTNDCRNAICVPPIWVPLRIAVMFEGF
jgi:hypothetical protein